MTSAGVSWPVSWVGVAGFEPAASSSRSEARRGADSQRGGERDLGMTVR